jgi:hypothetical protein
MVRADAGGELVVDELDDDVPGGGNHHGGSVDEAGAFDGDVDGLVDTAAGRF